MRKIRIGDKVYMKDDISRDVYTVTNIRPKAYIDDDGKEIHYNMLECYPDNRELASGFTEDYNVELVPQRTTRQKSINELDEVTSRMKYIDEDLLPIAEFVLQYANRATDGNVEVPLYRVLDALVHRGGPCSMC